MAKPSGRASTKEFAIDINFSSDLGIIDPVSFNFELRNAAANPSFVAVPFVEVRVAFQVGLLDTRSRIGRRKFDEKMHMVVFDDSPDVPHLADAERVVSESPSDLHRITLLEPHMARHFLMLAAC